MFRAGTEQRQPKFAQRLRYARTYQIKDVRVPKERLDDLKKFYRQIAADERSAAVLKRVP